MTEQTGGYVPLDQRDGDVAGILLSPTAESVRAYLADERIDWSDHAEREHLVDVVRGWRAAGLMPDDDYALIVERLPELDGVPDET